MSEEPRAPWASNGAEGAVRMHYACATCRQVREDRGVFLETVIRPGHAPMRALKKPCCFCKTREAICRVCTTAQSDCPIGHIAPERMEAIMEQAISASKTTARDELGWLFEHDGGEPPS